MLLPIMSIIIQCILGYMYMVISRLLMWSL